MSKYLKIYKARCPDDVLVPGDPRRSAILPEMRSVITARTLANAVKAVEWWEAGPNQPLQSARAFAQEARRLAEVASSSAQVPGGRR